MYFRIMKKYTLTFFISAFIVGSLNAATFTSNSDGNWQTPGMWNQSGTDADGIPDRDDDVIISAGHDVTFNTNSQALNLTIDGRLIGDFSSYRVVRIFNSCTNNGDVQGQVTFSFQGTSGNTLSGAGTFPIVTRITAYQILTIAPDVDIVFSFPGKMNIQFTSVTNQGSLEFTGSSSVTGVGGSSALINEGTITTATTDIMTTGNLITSAVGSNFNYNFSDNSTHTLLQPVGGYYNLSIQNSSATLNAPANIVVFGDLNTGQGISVTLDMNNFDLVLHGDWDLRANVFNVGRVTFIGTGTQTINGTSSFIYGEAQIASTSDVVLNTSGLLVSEDLIIDGSLDLGAANNSLYCQGDFTNNGSFIEREGAVWFNGTVAQEISGISSWSFFDMQVRNSPGVTMTSGTLTIENSLVIANLADFDVSAATLIFNSDATRTAYLDERCNGCTLTGDVIVRRYLPPGNADYRDMGTPVTGVTMADWDDDLIISATWSNEGCAYGPGCVQSVYGWDEATQTISYPSGLSDAVENGRGYEIFLGDNLNTWSGTTLTVTGPVNQVGSDFDTDPNGQVLIPCDAGFNLVANPFLSPIDFDDVNKTGGVQDFFYIYDASIGTFAYYDVSGGSVPPFTGAVNANGYITHSQAFWVEGSGFVNFNESDKVQFSTQPDFIKANVASNADRHFVLRLSDKNTGQFTYSSIIMMEDREQYEEKDVINFRGPETYLSTANRAPIMAFLNEKNLEVRMDKVERLDEYTRQVVTNFHKPGKYQFDAQLKGEMDGFSCILLYDKITGITTNLKQKEYEFTTAGQGKDEYRFTLTLKRYGDCWDQQDTPDLSSVQNVEFVQNAYGEITVNVNYSDRMKEGNLFVMDATGRVVSKTQYVGADAASYQVQLPAASGMYIVVIDYGDEKVTQKVIY